MASSWTPGFDSMPLRLGPVLVRNPPTSPDRKGKLTSGANGFLELNGKRVGLWVNDISSSFELSGSTSQAATHREFYAHNFTQPSITVSGQTPNNFQYNRLAEFVRQTQLASLDLGTGSTPLRLVVLSGGIPVPKALKSHIRGPHSAIWLDGFVPKIEAGAERFVTAHEYSFEFVILAAHSMLPSLSDRILVPFQLQQVAGDAIGERLKSGRKKVKDSRGSVDDNREATSTRPQYLGPTPVYENPDWYDHIPVNKR